jgi:hypothetical protein
MELYTTPWMQAEDVDTKFWKKRRAAFRSSRLCPRGKNTRYDSRLGEFCMYTDTETNAIHQIYVRSISSGYIQRVH